MIPINKTCFKIIAIAVALCCLVGCASAAGASQQSTQPVQSISDTVRDIFTNTELTNAQKDKQISEACGWTEKLNLFTQAKEVVDETTGAVTMDYSGLNTAGVGELYDYASGSLAYGQYLSTLAKVGAEAINPVREKVVKMSMSKSSTGVTGTGIESDPFVIYDGEDLNYVASHWGSTYYDAWFKLDDSFPATHFTLEKSLYANNFPFMGFFDGNGKIISATMPTSGMFNTISSGSVQKTVTMKDGISVSAYAIVHDFTFKDCTLDATGDTVGLLCKNIQSANTLTVVYNVDVSGGHVISASASVGGLCGRGSYGADSRHSEVKFSQCDADKLYVCSSASYHVGGLCGYGAATNANVTFEACTVKNSVVQSSASYSVGGLCGDGAHTNAKIVANGCTVENCRIVAASYIVGGLCGHGADTNAVGEYTDCAVIRCTISGTDAVGGIFGYFSGISATVDECTVQDSCVLATSGTAYGICP